MHILPSRFPQIQGIISGKTGRLILEADSPSMNLGGESCRELVLNLCRGEMHRTTDNFEAIET